MSTPLLAVEGLRKTFGGIVAVNGVRFQVAPQEIVGIIGPNGSGKSTLFNLISGVLRPDAGRIIFRGQDITGWKPYQIARLGIGRTFQIPAVFTTMTAWDNLLTAAVEADWAHAPQRAEQLLALLTLDAVRDVRADSLSGGQQKLLELGRVLMRNPTLILLDEVTAGVHPTLRTVMLDVVRELRRSGTTFLVIEHDMELVRTLCDRILVMDFGEVIASGTFAEIAAHPDVIEAYLGRRVS
ncbi:ABC transporter ATP-binding protein [Thermorudis peleae]|uniref:ABC transporter ATP-binding protein n=1 Tax=Thermorudis peleae TaxID=1382356 RepID=UPI00056FC278|nr:ABC transporter ATP-binding protein [Thermorudis peleae]